MFVLTAACCVCIALHFPTLRGLHQLPQLLKVVFLAQDVLNGISACTRYDYNRIRFPGRFRFAPLACRCQPLSHALFPLSSKLCLSTASLRDHHPRQAPPAPQSRWSPSWPYTFTGMLSHLPPSLPAAPCRSSLLHLHVLTLRRSPRIRLPMKSSLCSAAPPGPFRRFLRSARARLPRVTSSPLRARLPGLLHLHPAPPPVSCFPSPQTLHPPAPSIPSTLGIIFPVCPFATIF